MLNISVRKPENEPFFNPCDKDEEWKKITDAAAKFPKNFDIPMIINGEKFYSANKVKNINPSTGEVLGTVQQADEGHAKKAIEASLKAKKSWSELSPHTRIQKFRDLEVVLAKWKYEMLATSVVECGYTSLETLVEWAELMDFVRFNNFYYSELLAESLGDGWSETNTINLRPLKGFTCAVTPFNFPQAIGYHLPLVMALTGNTVVWKPSDDAVMSAYILMLALEEAAFPAGVINMITGDGKPCLPTVLTHPELSALNFTGSFLTAKAFSHYIFSSEFRRPNFPRFVAETGGKDFLYADWDIDIIDTAKAIVQGAFGRSGQKCSANSVVLPHEKIWHELKEILVNEASKLNMTNPLDRKSDLGPVINERQFDKVVAYLDRAKKDPDCKILCGGTYSKEKGFYIRPTIIEVSVDKHELLSEEVFGPVTAVRVVKDLSHAESIISQHNYRLTGSVMSRNEETLEKCVHVLGQYAGNLYVNRKTTGAIVNMQPFGGDASSGTNCKAGGAWYLLNFISQGTVTRRHDRTTTKNPFDKMLTTHH